MPSNEERPVETNLYYCNSRFYDPEVLRWISIDEINYLDSESASGINLWCYCNNNPVMGVDYDGNEFLTLFLIGVLGTLIAITILAADTPSAEKTGPTLEKPEFLKTSDDEFTIVSIGGNLGRKDWYIDKNKDRSIYFSGFNFGFSFGTNKKAKKGKDLFDYALNIFSFGYSGKYIDVHISLGKSDNFSIDFWQIIKDIFHI